jgi:hypothetical protein
MVFPLTGAKFRRLNLAMVRQKVSLAAPSSAANSRGDPVKIGPLRVGEEQAPAQGAENGGLLGLGQERRHEFTR